MIASVFKLVNNNSFNRYMVECEYSITFIFDFTPSVLIDTWWNVNK